MKGSADPSHPLHPPLTLRDTIDTLFKEVFGIDEVKSWKSVLISASSYALGLFMIEKSPWYLRPLAWAWTRTAVTEYMNEADSNWRLMKTVMTICHVYDKQENYIAFDRLVPEESQLITLESNV